MHTKIMRKLKQIEITDGEFIPFQNRTNNLGRAEFILCPIYKRGKLVELFIFRKQQENVTEFYHWQDSGKGVGEMMIQSYGLDAEPKVWRTFYCKEHKTQSLEIYVPEGSNYIWFSRHSFCLNIGFIGNKF